MTFPILSSLIHININKVRDKGQACTLASGSQSCHISVMETVTKHSKKLQMEKNPHLRLQRLALSHTQTKHN